MCIRLLGGSSLFSLCLALTGHGQAPQYFVTPAAKLGGTVQLALVGQPRHTFASFVDLKGGPQSVLGEEFFLGLGGTLVLFDTGTFNMGGLHYRALTVPSTGVPTGVVFYLQALVLDSQAPNGSFRVSNGESTVLHNATQVMVEEFTDPVLQGFTGNYDKSRRHRLLGMPPRRRVHTVKPTQGAVFGSPVAGPLNPNGARVQMVYRASDLGANGEREVLTAVRWLPRGSVQTATYKRLLVDVGHTQVVPDYTIDPWTAFPRFPNSGLATNFAMNQKTGEKPVRIFDGSYTLRPQDVRPDGYVSYPRPAATFTYNGFNSLLLDFRMEATPKLTTANGQQIQLMVLSTPQPNARIHASGRSATIVDPHTVTSGRGDNSMTYMQFEFVRIESQALSPWRKAPVLNPNFHKPALATSEPPGTRIVVEYRGARSANGTGAGMWSADVNNVDGHPYIRYRVTLLANPWTGAVPSLESIVIPIN